MQDCFLFFSVIIEVMAEPLENKAPQKMRAISKTLEEDKLSNESKTASLFRELLRNQGYYRDPAVRIEEGRSEVPKIRKLLRAAAKHGEEKEYPDFIITRDGYPELVIVAECKSDPGRHQSEGMDHYETYAVDGALLYASFLSREYDVLAIGISGETADTLRISHFIHLRGERESNPYFEDRILPIKEYREGIRKSTYKFNQDYQKLLAYTKTLNELLHARKIKESQRALLISGILIALRNDAFRGSYQQHKTVSSLVDSFYAAISSELIRDYTEPRVSRMLAQSYAFLKTNTTLSDKKTGKQFLEDLITQIDQEVNGFMTTHQYVDTISQFYVEFLRYANNDKGLSIVLTPPHITDLFVALAGVNKNSVVLDNCCGTGGFLINSMKAMLADAKGDESKVRSIMQDQLIGIEYQDDIYTLLVSNMILHHNDSLGDIYWGDCFQLTPMIREKHKEHLPTVGLLNPPYRTKASDLEELQFVFNNLETLSEGGVCIAIVPISNVIERSETARALRAQILKEHTLEAVLSLPEELFHNSKVNIVTCAIIITAHRPHPPGKKTWFGYCRDDGFVKVKNRGRIDAHHTWDQTRDRWVRAYRGRDVIPGFSAVREVTADDEWCAEAYLDTDYTQFTLEDYEKTVRQYLMFCLMDKTGITEESEAGEDGEL